MGILEKAGGQKAILAIVVSALGYFVDIYDLVLFSIVRIPSLKGLGYENDYDLRFYGELLLNFQMAGMLLGGIFWGILGDRRGRLSVLFGSIFMYSLANFLNGLIPDTQGQTFWNELTFYAILRFIAGIGLSGELGAGVTLVSELMPKESRGYGTMIVAGTGILGAILAALIGDFLNWRWAYIIGGIMGFALLILRIGVYESGLFDEIRQKDEVRKGVFLKIFSNKDRLRRFFASVMIGIPLWFVVGNLVTFSREYGKNLQALEEIDPGYAILFTYLGLAIGDFASGSLSQIFKTRKKTVFGFLVFNLLTILLYLNSRGQNLSYYYTLFTVLGFFNGYWAVFVTIAAEQFGTNLRATVATSVPNFVRGAVVPVNTTFSFLAKEIWGDAITGMIGAAYIMTAILFSIAFAGLYLLEETHGKDLNYLEQI